MVIGLYIVHISFLLKNAKNENRLCGGHKSGRLDSKMWESLRIEIPGEGCTSLPRLKTWFCLSALPQTTYHSSGPPVAMSDKNATGGPQVARRRQSEGGICH